MKRHVLTGESGIGIWFHEDRFGVFWIVYGPDGSIATFDRKTNKLTRYGFDSRGPESNLKNPAYPYWRTTKAPCGLERRSVDCSSSTASIGVSSATTISLVIATVWSTTES